MTILKSQVDFTLGMPVMKVIFLLEPDNGNL